MSKKYDFCGYATKNDLKCADGRIIRKDAFKVNDGESVPLVYMHNHVDPMNILGHADLENRSDGVFAYCSLNDSAPGKHMREVLKHGDVKALSIQANQLQQQGSEVLHGRINEVSIVLRGANPGATIENVMFAHADGFEYESEVDAIITTGEDIEIAHDDIEHADDEDQNGSQKKDSESDDETIQDVLDSMTDEQRSVVDYMMAVAADGEIDETVEVDEEIDHADDGPTIQDIWDSMSDKQKTVANYLIGKMIEDSDDEVDEEVEIDETIEQDDMEGDTFMYQNVFNQNTPEKTAVALTHGDMEEIVKQARTGFMGGSLKEVALDYIQHNFELEANDDPSEALQHGIEALDILFPEAKAVTPTPELVSRQMDWVSDVWNSTKKSPFARIKSTAADITKDEARARGYVKGKKKIEEVVKLMKRVTTPQTVYKLQKLDRDDVIDATELDVVAWLKQEMRLMLNEELSRAILIGDGRADTDESKIKEENIRPIVNEDDFFAIKYDVTIPANGDRLEKSDAIVDAAILAREDYMGSGAPVLYAPINVINTALLARDKMGHRLYRTLTELADSMNVSKIVEVPVMKGFKRVDEDEKEHEVYGIIVNLKDYTIGADRGGEVNLFDDFDINYNKYEYLIETRCSGALTKPYSAIVLQASDDDPSNDDPSNGDASNGDEIAG